MSLKPIEEQLKALQGLPSPRFYRRMARAAWTPAGSVRRRMSIASAALLLFLAAMLAFTPQGRAWAQEIVRLFTRHGSDTRPVEPAVPSGDWTFDLSVAEAESRAGYDVLEPAWLPPVVCFEGAAFDPASNLVRISYFYCSEAHGPGLEANGLILMQQSIPAGLDCEICDSVGASAAIEPVQISGAPGEYVVGVWQAAGDTGRWEWVSDPWLQRLRWQADGMAFELTYMGLPEEVTKADLIAVAESMK